MAKIKNSLNSTHNPITQFCVQAGVQAGTQTANGLMLWEYKLDGAAKVTTYVFGMPAPPLEASTGMGELGLPESPHATGFH